MPTPHRTAAALAAALITLCLAPAATASAPEDGPTVLTTRLKASGDTDGSGNARVTLRPKARKVCATISWNNIGDPTAAHIHRASDGFVLVDLTGAVTGGARCTAASKKVIKRIAAHPGRYYVNVHNATYPAGAVQGTLHG
ncbi:CHRD domain-containing protein [Nocardioides okcheonensis]|uniref:CHRD domain-containing protein n=1 Tax=Nocardioides okcheonensis TaxID=2894081 RepID=UPI001E37A66C|nr:CHRD domain-containing protein [Nocardioides okcheonensis]UFN42895.1 CHRD domain-containing protein [Nocardioides okcheonensis]